VKTPLRSFLRPDAYAPFFSFGRRIASPEAFFHGLKFRHGSPLQSAVMMERELAQYRGRPFARRTYIFAGFHFGVDTLEHYLLLKTVMRSKLTQHKQELLWLMDDTVLEDYGRLGGWHGDGFGGPEYARIIRELRQEFQCRLEETGSINFTSASEFSAMTNRQFLFGDTHGVRPHHKRRAHESVQG